MNREEAANWLEHYCYGNTNILRDCDDDIAEKIQTAMDEAIAALRGPRPDPITGLVPCGCGGQGLFEGAYLDEEVPSSYRVCLSCIECGMSTAEYEYEQEAMRAWNTAMGQKGGAE